MSALLVSEVSRRRDYWRNTAVTPTKIQSSWRRIFVDRSYHTGPFLVGWSLALIGTPRASSPLQGKKYIRGVFDKETRRKPLAFAADALSYGILVSYTERRAPPTLRVGSIQT